MIFQKIRNHSPNNTASCQIRHELFRNINVRTWNFIRYGQLALPSCQFMFILSLVFWSKKLFFWTCKSEAHQATAPQHIPTQHDMLPQHPICKYELNWENCNITLARNKAPWWWSDKIETCQSVFKNVLKVFYVKLYVHSLVDILKWFCKKCTVLQ